ncbi:hypothetical protein P3T35_003124 [Kitasatospora sp. GP30]|uniref:hypothetical protein n=1 Tax=Kitasatospora sp. GP30 TaxID=3035084 RepID=UPI000CBA32FE|nr:hypothetical protein [Kitasatospora sp. GP30]MDH6141111.1 hypothetical protein [Kitasatospora sp. GP30]
MNGLQSGLTLAAMWLPTGGVIAGWRLAGRLHARRARAARHRARAIPYIPQQRKAL